MAKPLSNFSTLLGRVVKGIVGILLIPPVIGLAVGMYRQLESISLWDRLASQWFGWGVVSYVGVHLFFYKPTALFHVSHAMLAKIAVWLFGGQVATGGAAASKSPKAHPNAKGKPHAAQGSTLVVLSPYLIPFYVILVSVLAWLAAHWWSSEVVNAVAILLIGVSLLLHVCMTADDLQQDRSRFPVEMYLIALAISWLGSLIVTTLCLSMAVPGFSLAGVFAEATATTHTIYATLIKTLFL